MHRPRVGARTSSSSPLRLIDAGLRGVLDVAGLGREPRLGVVQLVGARRVLAGEVLVHPREHGQRRHAQPAGRHEAGGHERQRDDRRHQHRAEDDQHGRGHDECDDGASQDRTIIDPPALAVVAAFQGMHQRGLLLLLVLRVVPAVTSMSTPVIEGAAPQDTPISVVVRHACESTRGGTVPEHASCE